VTPAPSLALELPPHDRRVLAVEEVVRGDPALLLGRRLLRFDLDGACALGRAKRLEVRRAFIHACEALRRTFGATVPGLALPAREAEAPHRAARRLLALCEGRPMKAPVRRLAELAYGAVLSDRPLSGARYFAHHLWRVTRRRLQRRLPGLFPIAWAG